MNTPYDPTPPNDAATPTERPAGARDRNRTPLYLGGGLAGIVVILAIVFGSLYATGTAPFADDDAVTATGGGDDTTAITAVATQYADSLLNKQDIDAVSAVLCAQDAQTIAGMQSGPGRPADQQVSIDGVSDITVDGDTAHASITVSGDVNGQRQQDSETIPFVREDGEWKACPSADAAARGDTTQGTPEQQAPGQRAPGQNVPEQAPAPDTEN